MKSIHIVLVSLLFLMTSCVSKTISTDEKTDMVIQDNIPNNISEEMRKILTLAMDYVEIDNFTVFPHTLVDNTLLRKYESGVDLTYEELMIIAPQLEKMNIYSQDIELIVKRSLNILDEEHEIWYPANIYYAKKADISNERAQKIIITFDCGGSPNNTYTVVISFSEDNQVELLYSFLGGSTYRIVSYEGTYYLIKPWFWHTVWDGDIMTEGTGAIPALFIAYLEGNSIEYYVIDANENIRESEPVIEKP